jgi:hypothetical protein
MHDAPAHGASYPFDERLMREQNLSAVDDSHQEREEHQKDQRRLDHTLPALVS